jgi:hypothetical protein
MDEYNSMISFDGTVQGLECVRRRMTDMIPNESKPQHIVPLLARAIYFKYMAVLLAIETYPKYGAVCTIYKSADHSTYFDTGA